MIVTLQTERVQTLADVRAVIDGNDRLDYQFTDREAARRFKAHIVNYADDCVVLGQAPSATMRTAVESLMQRLKLTVNVDKTRCCRVPEESFEFLGYRIGRNYRRDTGRAYIGSRPSQASVQSICRRISELTARRKRLVKCVVP